MATNHDDLDLDTALESIRKNWRELQRPDLTSTEKQGIRDNTQWLYDRLREILGLDHA